MVRDEKRKKNWKLYLSTLIIFFLNPEKERKKKTKTTHLVRGGGAEPHERAHGVGALAEEIVLLVARDLVSKKKEREERDREGERERERERRVSEEEEKREVRRRRPTILAAAPACARCENPRAPRIVEYRGLCFFRSFD